jgi:hypothetical protein
MARTQIVNGPSFQDMVFSLFAGDSENRRPVKFSIPTQTEGFKIIRTVRIEGLSRIGQSENTWMWEGYMLPYKESDPFVRVSGQYNVVTRQGWFETESYLILATMRNDANSFTHISDGGSTWDFMVSLTVDTDTENNRLPVKFTLGNRNDKMRLIQRFIIDALIREDGSGQSWMWAGRKVIYNGLTQTPLIEQSAGYYSAQQRTGFIKGHLQS